MLVLTRRKNETIRIGDEIIVTVIESKGGSVRIGIQAPQEIRIVRSELIPGSQDALLKQDKAIARTQNAATSCG